MGAAAQAESGQILWRCRRGMKELDILLERYARRDWPAAAAPERCAFEALLELPDPRLAGYLLAGDTPADPQLAQLVARLRTYVA